MILADSSPPDSLRLEDVCLPCECHVASNIQRFLEALRKLWKDHMWVLIMLSAHSLSPPEFSLQLKARHKRQRTGLYLGIPTFQPWDLKQLAFPPSERFLFSEISGVTGASQMT